MRVPALLPVILTLSRVNASRYQALPDLLDFLLPMEHLVSLALA